MTAESKPHKCVFTVILVLSIHCLTRSREQGEREGLPTKLLSFCQQIASGMSFLVDRGCVVTSLTTKCVLLSEKDVCKVSTQTVCVCVCLCVCVCVCVCVREQGL